MTPTETLREGKILLYPTDTLYGLGVNAANPEAINKLRELKGRPAFDTLWRGKEAVKPISIIVADIAMAEEYAEVTPLARRLAEKFLPGKLTLVLNAKKTLPDELTAGTGTVGIRIPNHVFCLNLAREFGRSFTATSANVSDREPKKSVPEILAQFGERAALIDRVVDSGELLESLPSTVVDARGKKPVVVRAGAIPEEEIFSV